MLVILVRLDGDAGQRRIRRDALRLADMAEAGGKAAVEQREQVDLAARCRQRVKIKIVDVDIAALMRRGILRLHQEGLGELLGGLGAVAQHGTHGGVAVDVGVFALDVRIGGILERDLLKLAHEAGIHLPRAAALLAVKNIGLGRAAVALLHQHLLHKVLHMLDLRLAALELEHGLHLAGKRVGDVLHAGLPDAEE